MSRLSGSDSAFGLGKTLTGRVNGSGPRAERIDPPQARAIT